MTLSTTALVNLACLEVPCKTVVSINDNTPRAEIARLVYPQVMDELMELDWSFQTRRVALTALAENAQPGIWGYAYQVPAGLGFPLHLRPVRDINTVNLQVGQRIGQPWLLPHSGLAFDIEAGVIWANSEAVELEYIASTPDFSAMTASFVKAATFGLAARMVMSITGDKDKRDDLIQKAEVYRDRALAADVNRNASANTYGDNFIPSTLMGHFYASE